MHKTNGGSIMKTKIAVLALIAVTAGVFTYKQTKHIPPSDLRDAVADVSDSGTGIADVKKVNVDLPAPEAAGNIYKDYAAKNVSFVPVMWASIPGGTFMMGTDCENGYKDARPVHNVTIEPFYMSKTEVTVEQYAECVTHGQCTAPKTGPWCNWGHGNARRLHPVNCVTWKQARQYARFVGARLPSESEWEYAARSGGKYRNYPWGNKEPTCNEAVMCGNGDKGCGNDSTMRVCSKPAGNTAQGLCDMAGNVREWVQDKYGTYGDTPTDGRAYVGPTDFPFPTRVTRGGDFAYYDIIRNDYSGRGMGATDRNNYKEADAAWVLGFGLARPKNSEIQ